MKKLMANNHELYSFWQIFIRALNLSPLDGNSMPTVTMLQHISGEVFMEEEDFWQAAEYSLCYLRNHIIEKREQARRKAEMEARARRNKKR
jgi:hypothetical protein